MEEKENVVESVGLDNLARSIARTNGFEGGVIVLFNGNSEEGMSVSLGNAGLTTQQLRIALSYAIYSNEAGEWDVSNKETKDE